MHFEVQLACCRQHDHKVECYILFIGVILLFAPSCNRLLIAVSVRTHDHMTTTGKYRIKSTVQSSRLWWISQSIVKLSKKINKTRQTATKQHLGTSCTYCACSWFLRRMLETATRWSCSLTSGHSGRISISLCTALLLHCPVVRWITDGHSGPS